MDPERIAFDVCYRLLVVLVVWKCFWFVAYRLLGVYLGYLSINNGFLFNCLEWRNRKFRITASSVRIRLWGNSKKFIVLDLTVEIHDRGVKKTNHQRRNRKVSTTPLSIYPENRVGKFIFEQLIRILPSVDVDFKLVKFLHKKLLAELDSLRLLFKTRKSSHNAKVYRYGFLIAGKLLEGTLSVLQCLVPFAVGLFALPSDFSIDTSCGKLSGISSRIHIDDLSVNVFQLTKLLVQQKQTKPHPHHSIEEIQPQLDLLATLHNKFYECFQDFSINIACSRIDGIPLFPAGDNCSLTEYLTQEEPDSSIRLSVNSAAFHMARMLDTDAGFDVLFDSTSDKPIELTSSALLIKLSFVTKLFNEATNKHYRDVDEFFNFPNCTFNFKSNFNDHLAKGLGFRNCVIELFLTGSSPMFDVDADQFALLAFNYVVIRKLFKLKKMRRIKSTLYATQKGQDLSETESDDDTKVEFSQPGTPAKSSKPVSKATRFTQLVDKAVLLLNEYYPKIDVKFTIEQPRFVLRTVNGDSVQLLMLSYSTMFFHVMTADSDDYIAKCHFLHPCMNFSERYETASGSKYYQEEVFGASHARLRVDVKKNLKFKINSSVSGAFVSLAKPDVLNGLNSILDVTTKEVNDTLKSGLINLHYDSEIVKERDFNAPNLHKPKELALNMGGIFDSLPSWLISFEFTCSNSEMKLGSVSPLLPPELISKLSEVANRTVEDTKNVLSFRIEDFNWSLNGIESLENDSSASSSSLDTLTAESASKTFWKINTATRKVRLCFIENGICSTPILNVPNISSSLSAVVRDDDQKIILDFDIDEILGFIDKYRVFAMIGLIYLLKVTIIEPLKKLKEKIRKSTATLRLNEKKTTGLAILEILISDINVHQANFIAALSDEFKIRLQLYSTTAKLDNGVVVVSNKFARLLADSPIMNGYWNRIVCLDELRVGINDPEESHKIVFSTPSMRIIQPHRFVVYKLFDNLGIFLKIGKHLVKCFKSDKKSEVALPKESPALKVPHMRIKASKLTFTIEDDPFESELNMIYQLGLQEQRKRMEMMDLFNERTTGIDHESEEYQKNIEEIQKTIELLWIRKVQMFKFKIADEIIQNKDYMFGAELQIPESENHRVSAYFKHAPLLHMIMSGFDLDLSSPTFPLKELPDFIYKYGQQVPKDTRYNLMLPCHLDLAVDEVRMHMRDYPLPLLYLPRSANGRAKEKAVILRGDMVISETLVLDQEHLRRLEVRLSKEINHDPDSKNFDKLIIEKSMSSVKIFTNLDVLFNSHAPARFVWGQSYQFAIQQIMLNVDQFSKPPVDPSAKLGFWDKMRLVLHGKCRMRTGPQASIEVAFKGGRDPYNLFALSSGFILSFKDHVQWNINEDDNSLNFFDISARKVAWYIPNYLESPLVCWCRDSSKLTYFAATKNLVTSCYAYYLDDLALSSELQKIRVDSIEKSVVELSGGVRFVLGFMLQRKTGSGDEVSEECKPHYEVNLWNPEFTKEGHDSYAGFRSDRLHMAISLVANTDKSYNTIHLSPEVFKQFFMWWKLFHGNMMLPIRRGKVFGETKKSTKFSEHLFTIKYLFDLKNLFISHILRGEALNDADDFVECVGLRAKVDKFLVDLHQRKEERIDEREELSRHKKIMKMVFNRGEVNLTTIDLRAMYAKFLKNLYKQDHSNSNEKCKYVIFDRDYQWFERRDFDEAFVPSSGGKKSRVEALPLMFSENFSYIRDTTDNKSLVNWGHEKTHECSLDRTDIFSTQIEIYRKRLDDLQNGLTKTNNEQLRAQLKERIDIVNKNIKISEKHRRRLGRQDSVATALSFSEHFHNRFVLISTMFKWNENVRNLFMKYIHFVQLNKNLHKFLSFEFMTMLDNIVQKNDGRDDDVLSLASSVTNTHHTLKKLKSFLNKFQSSRDRLENFDEIIRNVIDSEMVMEDYKIEIISPQIQLNTVEEKNSIVLITAPILEAKILSVVTKKESHLTLNAKELETRYGVLLHDACVMVLDKKGIASREVLMERRPYGTTTNWPPFLGIEVCKDNSLAPQNDILIEKMSLMVTYDLVKALGSSIDQMEGNVDTRSHAGTIDDSVDDSLNRLRVDVPELVINCTSRQYFTLYVTVLSLLLYSEPMSVHLREKLSKLKFSINFQDFSAVQGHLLGLHRYLDGTRTIANSYNFRHTSSMDNESLNEYLLLISEEHNIATEIVLILQTLFGGDVFADSKAQLMEDWRIAADKIVLHMLRDDRQPILDLIIDGGVCKRLVKEDGSNDNRIEIRNIEGISKVPDAYFDKFLAPINLAENDDLITVEWSMNRSVGGIKIMENFDISSMPLNVKIDENTGRLLMEFIFYSDDEDKLEKSPVVKATGKKQTEAEFGRNDKSSDSEDTGDDDHSLEQSDDRDVELDHRESNKGNRSASSSNHGKEVHFRERSHSSTSRRLRKKSSTKDSSLTSSSTSSNTESDDDVTEMIKRSKKYLTIVAMTSHSFDLMISLRMKKGMMRWLNVTNFKLSLPEWHIDGEVMSMLDIADKFKRLVIKALLNHSGLLVKNKLRSRGANARRKLKRSMS